MTRPRSLGLVPALRLAAFCALATATPRVEAAPFPFQVRGRLGAGYDSNPLLVGADNQGRWMGHGAVSAFAEPASRVHLALDGAYELRTGDPLPNDAEAAAVVLARPELRPGVQLILGSATRWEQSPSLFIEGQLSPLGAVARAEGIQTLVAGATLSRGNFDLELTAEGEGRKLWGAENHAMLSPGGRLAARWVPSQQVALHGAYLYAERYFSGFPPRLRSGELPPEPVTPSLAKNLELQVHSGKLGLRFRPAPLWTLSAHYQLSSLRDGFEGYFSGLRHEGRLSVQGGFGERLLVELGVDPTHRLYPERLSSADNPSNETFVGAYADVELWLTEHFGIYARYQLESAWTDTTGHLFTRHLISVGPSVRARRQVADDDSSPPER